MKGKISWFNTKKGFGFITPDEKIEGVAKDVFLHYSGIEKGLLDKFNRKFLKDGQVVEFELDKNDKGPVAINTKLIEEQVSTEAK